MESVLLAAAMMAASTNAAPVNEPAAGAMLDQRCFRLMADLAEDRDPRVQGLGRMAAQYFLGRIDAANPGFDPDAVLDAPPPPTASNEVAHECTRASSSPSVWCAGRSALRERRHLPVGGSLHSSALTMT